jgi:hypothetical protein
VEDFRDGWIWSGGDKTRMSHGRQDKGFDTQFAQLAAVLRGSAEPPPAEGYLISTLATFAAARSLETGQPEPVVSSAADGDQD